MIKTALPFLIAPLVAVSSLAQETLPEARADFETRLTREDRQDRPLPVPPAELFSLVEYDAPSGPTSAYLSRSAESEEPLPAIVWITGGFPTARGGAYIWETGPPDNEQSATAFRDAGVVMLFPTVRGTGENPGLQEHLMGEVDDVLAAAEYVRGLAHVDPARVYLGGHSTGGTLALLVAESTDVFRAVFSFGPVDEFSNYGLRGWPFDSSDEREMRLRSPVHFLDGITSPTYVIEGQYGRAAHLERLANATENPNVVCISIEHANHFTPLAPINRYLAEQVREQRTGPFRVSPERVREAYREGRRAQREARDLAAIEALRAEGVALGTPRSLRYSLADWERDNVASAARQLREAGFTARAVRELENADGETYYRVEVRKVVPLRRAEVFAASATVRRIANEQRVEDEGWVSAATLF